MHFCQHMPYNGVRPHIGQPRRDWRRRDRDLFYDNLETGRACCQDEFSAIREILKLTDRPGIISMAGGLPLHRPSRWMPSPRHARP